MQILLRCSKTITTQIWPVYNFDWWDVFRPILFIVDVFISLWHYVQFLLNINVTLLHLSGILSGGVLSVIPGRRVQWPSWVPTSVVDITASSLLVRINNQQVRVDGGWGSWTSLLNFPPPPCAFYIFSPQGGRLSPQVPVSGHKYIVSRNKNAKKPCIF